MMFSLNGKAVRENTINGDDTIRDVALKLTKGQGGVYLYGKQKRDSSSVTVWQKYKRALTSYEMTAELRNLGIQRKVGDQEFDYEDLGDYIPRCEYEYVALGQILSRGVRVKPPKQTYSLGEYLNVSSVAQPEMRLTDYPELTEVHAVTMRYLMQVYLPHPAGIVPQDAALTTAVSTWVWNIMQETYLLPKAPQCIDLADLFSKVHAAELVPYISFGKMVRLWNKDDMPSLSSSEGMTFHLKEKGSVTFYRDGKVKCVRADPYETNPIVHYVNQVLAWGTALECDWMIIGKSTALASLFSDAFFPLWTSATKERITISAPFDAVAYAPSPAWHYAFSPTLEYVRCSPPASVDLSNSTVYIRHLPAECISFASRYAEGMLLSAEGNESDTCWMTEASEDAQNVKTVEQSEAFIAKFAKAGYEMGLRYRGGALCIDEKSNYGFLPCPDLAEGVNQGLLEEWVPTLGYTAVKQFLVSAARVDEGVEPRESVLDHKGEYVGIRTRNGAFVRCKTEPVVDKGKNCLRKTTEHALRFPKTGHLNGTYRELVRLYGFGLLKAQKVNVIDARTDDFPQWREGKLMLTRRDLEEFETQLKNEMARFHRLRCYMTRRTVEVNGICLDLLNAEQVIVL